MSENPELLVEREDKILILTINRDERRNALNAALCQEIEKQVRQASHDAQAEDKVRVVLFRGAGRAFCAGADLGSTKPTSGEAGGVYSGNFHESLWSMLAANVNAAIPVIADIQGPAVGAGTQLALSCDLRVVGERAWFGVPASSLGFALDAWTINRAKDLLGGSIARNVLVGGRRVSAEQAVASGFAAEYGDSDRALEFAREIAEQAPLATWQLKQALNAFDDVREFSSLQQELYERCWASEDAAEAGAARKEKRKPVFRRR